METFLVTRPRIVTKLMKHGCNVAKVPNPYSPERPAWEVEKASKSARIIAAFYTDTGIPCPRSVATYIKTMEVGGVNA